MFVFDGGRLCILYIQNSRSNVNVLRCFWIRWSLFCFDDHSFMVVLFSLHHIISLPAKLSVNWNWHCKAVKFIPLGGATRKGKGAKRKTTEFILLLPIGLPTFSGQFSCFSLQSATQKSSTNSFLHHFNLLSGKASLFDFCMSGCYKRYQSRGSLKSWQPSSPSNPLHNFNWGSWSAYTGPGIIWISLICTLEGFLCFWQMWALQKSHRCSFSWHGDAP